MLFLEDLGRIPVKLRKLVNSEHVPLVIGVSTGGPWVGRNMPDSGIADFSEQMPTHGHVPARPWVGSLKMWPENFVVIC